MADRGFNIESDMPNGVFLSALCAHKFIIYYRIVITV